MTFKELASAIAKREGGKNIIKIGDAREVLKILREINEETSGGVALFFTKEALASLKKKEK